VRVVYRVHLPFAVQACMFRSVSVPACLCCVGFPVDVQCSQSVVCLVWLRQAVSLCRLCAVCVLVSGFIFVMSVSQSSSVALSVSQSVSRLYWWIGRCYVA